MSLTVNTKTYNNDVSRSPDIYRYVGPDHTLSANDYMDLARTAPKPTVDFAGKGRARVKLTRTMTDGTDALGDGIADFSISIPVGASSTEQDALIDDIAAWLATTAAKDLIKKHDIVQ